MSRGNKARKDYGLVVTKTGWFFLRRAIRDAGYESIASFVAAMQKEQHSEITRLVLDNLCRGNRFFPIEYAEEIARQLKTTREELLLGLSEASSLSPILKRETETEPLLSQEAFVFLGKACELLGPLSLQEVRTLLLMRGRRVQAADK